MMMRMMTDEMSGRGDGTARGVDVAWVRRVSGMLLVAVAEVAGEAARQGCGSAHAAAEESWRVMEAACRGLVVTMGELGMDRDRAGVVS